MEAIHAMTFIATPGRRGSMQREQLLNLLDQQARAAFEGAKRIALAGGGLVTPLHIVVSVLQSSGLENGEKELSSLLQAAREAIDARGPEASESITVSKETQTTISDAGQLAQLDGCARATPAHLLRAALRSQTVKEALGEVARFEQMAADVAAKTIQQASRDKQSDAEPGTQTPPGRTTQPADASLRPVRALTGALNDYCCDVAEDSRESSSHPFVGREREITAVLETLCRKLKSNPCS
jgi:ATP-dependent Clp protease ATP-binding subunit ClpA